MESTVPELNSTSFKDEVLKAEVPVVVEFYTPTCPYCRRLTPIFKELSTSYSEKIKFALMDASSSPDIASGYGIMGVPTLKFFCAGRPIHEIVGFRPKEDLVKEFDMVLKKHSKCVSQSSALYS